MGDSALKGVWPPVASPRLSLAPGSPHFDGILHGKIGTPPSRGVCLFGGWLVEGFFPCGGTAHYFPRKNKFHYDMEF